MSTRSHKRYTSSAFVMFVTLAAAGCIDEPILSCEDPQEGGGPSDADSVHEDLTLRISDDGWSKPRLVGEANWTFGIVNSGAERAVCVTDPDGTVLLSTRLMTEESTTIAFDRPGNYTVEDMRTGDKAHFQIAWMLRWADPVEEGPSDSDEALGVGRVGIA